MGQPFRPGLPTANGVAPALGHLRQDLTCALQRRQRKGGEAQKGRKHMLSSTCDLHIFCDNGHMNNMITTHQAFKHKSRSGGKQPFACACCGRTHLCQRPNSEKNRLQPFHNASCPYSPLTLKPKAANHDLWIKAVQGSFQLQKRVKCKHARRAGNRQNTGLWI